MPEEQLKLFEDPVLETDDALVPCNTEGVYWNRDRDSIEIHFSGEETPTARLHVHPVYFWQTVDGRVMKMEIAKVNFNH